MTRATAARPSRVAAQSRPVTPKGYFQRSETPLTSLVFLLPFLILYEVGAQYGSFDLLAFNWMERFFRLFGVYGRHLPALAVVWILVTWHFATRAPWRVEPLDVLGMFLESAILTVPLILLVNVSAQYLPMAGTNRLLPTSLIMSAGAGIYEELIFRLAAFTLLSILFVDVLKLRRAWANLLMVLISSLAFSLYHYLGYETFQVRSFVFRAIAGIYFGAIFAYRGFGISAGTHASYDIVVTIIRSLG